jgi:hypothetical protein
VTAQIHELLLLDGEWTSMAFVPPLPEGHPRIGVASDEKQRAAPSILFSTACWRQYRGTWEIKGGRFSLIAIEGRLELKGERPLHADWFSGMLRVPRGEMIAYVHMGFGSVFEEELHIVVERGLVQSTRTIDNRGRSPDTRELGWRNLPGGDKR